MKNSSHQMMKLTFFPSKSDTRDCSFFFHRVTGQRSLVICLIRFHHRQFTLMIIWLYFQCPFVNLEDLRHSFSFHYPNQEKLGTGFGHFLIY